MYFLKVALNCALSSLRTVTLGGELLKIFMPAHNVLHFNSRYVSIWSMMTTMMLINCINIVYR